MQNRFKQGERGRNSVVRRLSLAVYKGKSVKLISALLLVAVFVGAVSNGFAFEPYIGHGYDWFWDTYPIQNGYHVERVVTSNELGLVTAMSNPRDMLVHESSTGEVYIFIVDSDNSRILVTDENFENVREMKDFIYCDNYKVQNFLGAGNQRNEEAYWEEVRRIGTKTTLNGPTGIFVTEVRGEIALYIADHFNERVVACDLDGNIWMEFRRPVTETFDSDTSFRPLKVIVDNAANVYVCLTNITRGAVVFDSYGNFRGYFGANRVTKTGAAVLNSFLRLVLSDEAMAQRNTPAPVEFSNFTIDKDQFIYTVTETRSAGIDIVKKLNPAGQNVFENMGRDDWLWGAPMQPFVFGKTYMSMITDITVTDIGDIFLLDRESGQIYHYDKEGSLMFIFGGKGNQKGLFNLPTAIETYGNKVYVLDSAKSSITVFKLTEFGQLVVDAMALFNSGQYVESIKPWEEVLKRDANYYMAYIGMGNAKLSLGEFAEALDFFYMHSYSGYDRAFKDFRINYIRENFDKMLVVTVAGIIMLMGGYYGVKYYRRYRAKAKEI